LTIVARLLRVPCSGGALFAYGLLACSPRSVAPPPVIVAVAALPSASTADVEASPPAEASAPDREPPVTAAVPRPSVVPTSSPPQAQALPPLSSLAPAHLTPATLATSLSNGLPFDLVVEVELVAPGSPPAVHAAGACSVTYDLWDQVYRIRLPAGPRATTNIDGVIRACTDRRAYADALKTTPGAVARQRIVRVKP
jgi:hypothetical protein